MSGQYSPQDNLNAYADALAQSGAPEAAVWAEALRWAASRVRGGHGSMFAHREFRKRFGMIAEDCGVGPWDGTELER